MTPPEANLPPRVLVVDDSPTVLRVVEGVLARAGYRVTCCDSGHTVAAVARLEQPALILVDFAMPEVSGYGVCQQLGADPTTATIPIVMMHTRGDAVAHRFLRELGILDHITKPFPPEVLLAVVEHTLEKRATVAEVGTIRTAPPPAPESPLGASAEQLRQQVTAALVAELRSGPADLPERIAEALARPACREALTALAAAEQLNLALHGDLALVPVAEVMQILALQRQSGILVLQQHPCRIEIALEGGVVRLVTGSQLPEEFLLGNFLIQDRLISAQELDLLLANRQGSRARLGTQLVKLGYLSRDDLRRVLRRQSSELVYELLRWHSGRFWFERLNALPEAVLEFEFDLSVEELLMEGYRRVDEWGLIETAIPSFDRIPVRTTVALEVGHNPTLTGEERAVLDLIDGRRDVQGIIQAGGRSSFEVARVLYRLVGSHLVTLTPAPAAAGADGVAWR